MTDDFANRAWAEHHKSFARNISDLAHSVMVAFDRLTARQFDAPWLCADTTRKTCTD